MKLVPETLARELARGLAPCWLVAGDEPLLVGEAADQIRARAKKDGYVQRDVLFVERGFDWGTVYAETQAMSLFAERRVLELRLPTPKPGTDGSKALAEIVRSPAPDLLLLVITDKIEWSDRSAAWVKAFEEHGAFVEVEQLTPERLPAWLVDRMRRAGLQPDDDAVQLLAERCEGNLVAAHQEIERLALLAGPGRVDLATVESAVANSARYTLFQLGEAALAGDAARATRVLDGLAAEGEEPVLVLWSLTEEVRALLQWQPNPPRGAPARLFRGGRRRQTLLGEAARRLPKPRLRQLLLDAAHADAVIKGARDGEPWSELLRIAAGIAGVPFPARPTA
jgi:DNA polymerase-3 subunit delta